jgi:nitrogen regulatory protein PII
MRTEKRDEFFSIIETLGFEDVMLTETKETAEKDPAVLDMTKVEISTHDGKIDDILEAIISICKKGLFGDGKITIMPMGNVIRVKVYEEKNK